MLIIKRIVLLICCGLVLIQCKNESTFKIEKGRVGEITKETTIEDLSVIFKSDSIVSKLYSESSDEDKKLLMTDDDDFLVYARTGEKLLEISFELAEDSIKRIKNVQLFNTQYITDKGVSLKSNFKELNENYTINKVETTLTSATLFIDELNATISIDKKDLGLKTFSREVIVVAQIPDNAKIKFFTIWFN